MIIGNKYLLDKYEQSIVELSANQRHNNKVKTGWDGFKTVNKNSYSIFVISYLLKATKNHFVVAEGSLGGALRFI